MSQLSARLSERDVNGVFGTAPAGHTTLDALTIGAAGIVSAVRDTLHPETARRLFDLGFVPGTPVVKKRIDVFRRTLIAEVGGYELALRAEQARCIGVTTQ